MPYDAPSASGWLAGHLPALGLAVHSLERLRAAAQNSGIDQVRDVPLDLERVAGSFGSDKLYRLGGQAAEVFAPLSGFFRTADGWVRTHANYPHHADRLCRLVGLDQPDRLRLAEAISRHSARDLEAAAQQAGALVVAVRSEAEWRADELGAAARGELVIVSERGAAAAGRRRLSGLRVLDMTRVLAGPVCTRALALFGADVLRVDPPSLPEIEWQHLDTGPGKRSTLIDLRTDRATAQQLLDQADVLVTGYRPGSIEALGLRVPDGVVHARINAWGDSGPWRDRRGFDSIVQAVSGIAMLESPDGETPGALAAQVLDHASGYLLAAGIIEAISAGAQDGRGRDVNVALARTANWLLDRPGRISDPPPAATPGQTVTHGPVRIARPCVPGFDDYPHPAHPIGSDQARWLDSERRPPR